MKVLMLTYCQNIENLYGNLLTFKTFRTGFPTTELIVYDNNSIPIAKHAIREEVKKLNGTFISLKQEVKHHDWIEEMCHLRNEPIVFCDPDMIFWDEVQWYDCPGLLGGRLVPTFYDDIVSHSITHERLHTCLLFVPQPRKLIQTIYNLGDKLIGFEPFVPVSLILKGKRHFWDTLGVFYDACPDECIAFDTNMLNSFDHLNNGTVFTKVDDKFSHFNKTHNLARSGQLEKLKGLWKAQDLYYKSRAVTDE